MSELSAGAQAKIRDLRTDPALNGKACVSLGASRDNATVRLGTGREVLVPLENLQLVALPGQLPSGTRVVAVGLSKAPTLNFRQACVAASSAPEGRLNIDFGSGDVKALKFENVVLLDPDAILDAAAQLGEYSRGSRVKICNFIDPGINGLTGIVLDRDPNDPTRLLVMLPEQGKVMAFRPEKMCKAAEGDATSSELGAIRPMLKDAFFLELRKLLWSVPQEQARLLTLLAPSGGVKANPFSMESRTMSAWTAFRSAYPADDEPLMRSTLRDKAELFALGHDATGNEMVALTEAGKLLSKMEGLPEPPTKRRRVESDSGKQGKDELVRALFCAMKLSAPQGQAIPMSQLGSDPRVAKLRQDARFKKLKLTELLREYTLIFELTPEAPPGTGLLVKLTEHADAALPQRKAGEAAPKGGGDVLPDPEQLRLPDKIEQPETLVDKMQALRIEIIHALFRRDGFAEPGQLGQEPGVQKMRRMLPKNKSLLDIIRVFLDNFSVAMDPVVGKQQVQLDSMDVGDMSCIEEFVQKQLR